MAFLVKSGVVMSKEAFEKWCKTQRIRVCITKGRSCCYCEEIFNAGRASVVDAEKIADKVLCEYFPDGANAELLDVDRLQNIVIAAIKGVLSEKK